MICPLPFWANCRSSRRTGDATSSSPFSGGSTRIFTKLLEKMRVEPPENGDDDVASPVRLEDRQFAQKGKGQIIGNAVMALHGRKAGVDGVPPLRGEEHN